MRNCLRAAGAAVSVSSETQELRLPGRSKNDSECRVPIARDIEKADHLGGVHHCEMTSPSPNRIPEASAERSLAPCMFEVEIGLHSDYVTGNEHGGDRACEKHHRCHNGAFGEAGDPTNSMAARAAATHARAKADEKAGGDHRRPW